MLMCLLSQDIPQFGEAPVRDEPTGPDRHRYYTGSNEQNRRHFPRHRHSRSKEEKPTSSTESEFFMRPATGKDDINVGVRHPREGSVNTMGSSTNLPERSTSPTPSTQSSLYRESGGQQSPGPPPNKRSLFDKLLRHKGPSSLKNLPGSSKSLLDSGKSKQSKRDASPARRGRQGSVEGSDLPDHERKKDSSGKGLGIGAPKFRSKRDGAYFGKDARTGLEQEGVWALDTDLEHMEGIISQPRPLSPTDRGGGIFDGTSRGDDGKDMNGMPAGNWDAPESWQVKKHGDDIVGRLPEIADDLAGGGVQDDGTSYFIRVFRIDSTFATLSAPLNATVADILVMLGRKSFLQDDLNNYEIVMRKNDLSRQLELGERPILMQKRLLEQVGYTAADKIEDIGREDHSYLCRFTFLPTKLSGYSSLEGDPGFHKMQKFSHVDLQGRSLVTIPIMLYRKASEIISLNLSRNLALDVPKDFIQSCINLREIKFMGNEAWRLPASFSLATRLTYLDVSNNRLEQLDHAHLDNLQGLVSIKLANNQLSQLPSYFGNFKHLRSLNISSNSFQAFPDFLCNLPSLVDLDVSFNSISELPNIGKLQTLERLWVTNNMLRGPLDESFKDLVNLKELDARFNSITNIDSISQLPRLELLLLGHNAISKFKGSWPKLRTLVLDHCPITQFDLDAPVPSLLSLNVASAKLVQFKDSLFENVPNLTRLILDKNHFSSLSPQIGKLRKLEYFSMIKNPLSMLPKTIGNLTELKYLNLRECNLSKLPSEIWYCLKLETLNVSSNVLDSFPKLVSQQQLQPPGEASGTPTSTPGISTTPSLEDLAEAEDAEARRPSQASGGLLNVGGSPSGSYRKASVASSAYGQGGARKVSTASRSTADGSSSSRKDSNFSQRVANTFAGSLRYLYLADNRLEDDVFRELSLLPELRVLNLSYNELTELPQGLLKRWPFLSELYLSGNELTSLPSDDLEEGSNLRTLHLNANRFQVLPAELCKVSKLSVLDVGSNSLKYNVSNWPYDWNWNWNHNLRYLNFSGNKRLEIKPSISSLGSAAAHGTDLTDFNSLTHLRVLGLMDVTLTTSTIPEETEDRRVRTSASLAGSLAYGMADYLGKNEHLSIIDMMVPRLRPDDLETVVGLFDGQAQAGGGSRIAKYLHENFTPTFIDELKKLQTDNGETPLDALRRTFLALNKDMAAAAYKSIDDREIRRYPRGSTAARRLNQDDINSGGVATVLYLKDMDLYVANVGDAQAVLVKMDGSHRHLTRVHDPAEARERARIRAAGGYVSRNGKLNDVLRVSRAFGYFPMIPAVIAAPDTTRVTLTEQDEMIILGSRELWEYVTPDLVVDVARTERRDLMIAAQKIRDLAISFGATNKLMVMILGVSDLKKREKYKFRGPSLYMGPSPFAEEQQIIPSTKRAKKPRDGPVDSRLARFDYVDAPIGELAIIFTDIKKSTALWETCPDAMRSAIQIHNDILRRQLGLIGGYEVKTEGDAFMVAFSTTTAALLWCFNCQVQLLEAEWPTEILEQPQCRERFDTDHNVIFRGLSVRMGIHWGEPVCEKDPVTNRMDYFGPMVNRASRISAVADGGQIFVSSDFMGDIQRNLEAYADYERMVSAGEEVPTDPLSQNIRRELQQLNSQGFVIKDQGQRKLKGLENPEPVYLIYPHSLSGRIAFMENMEEEEEQQQQQQQQPPTPTVATISKHSQLELQTDLIWRLWEITLRLERICSSLEHPGETRLREPNMALFNVVKNRGGELADSTVVSLVEQQVTRIEVSVPIPLFYRRVECTNAPLFLQTCVNTLAVRHLMRPFKPGDRLEDHAVPMAEVMLQLQTQLAEFKALKEQLGADNAADRRRSRFSRFPEPLPESPRSDISSASSSRVQSPEPPDLPGSE